MQRLGCALWAALYIALYRLRRRKPVFGPIGTPPPEDDKPPESPHYFALDLSPVMHARILDVMGRQAGDATNKAIVEALQLAERVNLPFTPPVDWDTLERRAREGYSVADQVFDWKKRSNQ